MVVRINLVFEVKLNVPRHDDERLPHQKQKYAFQQSHDQNQNSEQQNRKSKYVVEVGLQGGTFEQKVYIERIFY